MREPQVPWVPRRCQTTDSSTPRRASEPSIPLNRPLLSGRSLVEYQINPRLREARATSCVGPCNVRIIPARAGSTGPRSASSSRAQDHPRAYGEHL